MKIIDITHILDKETPVYPGDAGTQLDAYRTIEADGYNGYRLCASMHTGTHIDVPMHLIRDERMVKDFAADDFTGNGVVLDVRGEQCIEMKAEYTKRIKEKDIVLLYTGFDKYYHEARYFSGHPAVSAELGDFLVSKKIKMLGMDMPSPDHSPYTFHKKILEHGIFLLENAANLGELLGLQTFEVMAFPLKIAAEASPVRAVCRVK